MREVAKRFHCVEVKNGESTSFWYDLWCSKGRLLDLLGTRGFIEMGVLVNSTVAEAMHMHRRRHHRIEIFNKVEDEIEKLKHENHQIEDIGLWRSKNGKYKPTFSSKNTWLEIRKVYADQVWSKGVWFKHATPKYSFHTWTAMRDRLATCDRILKWNPNIDPLCVLCKQQMESRNHLFYLCSYSSRIWQSLTRGLLQSRYTEDWGEINVLLLDHRLDRIKRFLIRYTFQAAGHAIWREKNHRKHSEKELPYMLLLKNIDKTVKNKLSTIRRQWRDEYMVWIESLSIKY